MQGLLEIPGKLFSDNRGSFTEVYNEKLADKLGVDDFFVQDNFSVSAEKNTIRGLHAQTGKFAQSKLVRCLKGAIIDVVVDIRPDSSSFLEWMAFELSEEKANGLYIPAGFLHGFQTLVDGCCVFYKCGAQYAPESEITVHFADPRLSIDWVQFGSDAVISEKDRQGISIADLFKVSGN